MDFTAITPLHREALNEYFYRYGEDSCQHSVASSCCMNEKYGDAFCESGGWLYIKRLKRCGAEEHTYLAPMGGGDLSVAVNELLRDAHENGARLKFETVTASAARAITNAFPGVFRDEELRDYAEYIYTYERLALLGGHDMADKRHDISTFMRDYGDRTRVEIIKPEHIPAIRDFQAYWLRSRSVTEEDVQLELEDRAIAFGLDNFDALGLSGIVVFIGGELRGYAYGAPLSPRCYDVMIEKGDRSVPDIYRILNRELVRLCCGGFSYINREEDVGVEGLRKAKMSYKPDILLEKHRLTEVAYE